MTQAGKHTGKSWVLISLSRAVQTVALSAVCRVVSRVVGHGVRLLGRKAAGEDLEGCLDPGVPLGQLFTQLEVSFRVNRLQMYCTLNNY